MSRQIRKQTVQIVPTEERLPLVMPRSSEILLGHVIQMMLFRGSRCFRQLGPNDPYKTPRSGYSGVFRRTALRRETGPGRGDTGTTSTDLCVEP